MRAIATLVLLQLSLADGTAETTDTISQYGITWKFASPVPSGQFVNGDYWVVGPVTITLVMPSWDGTCNGSMVDPVPGVTQGYRASWPYAPKYDEALRAQFPLTLSGVHSLVSTIGLGQPAKGGAGEGLDTAAVLTVLDKAPPADAFRPPYVAGDKPIHTASQLHWDRLPKLPVPPGLKVPAITDTMMKRVWLDHAAMIGQAVATIHPRSNMEPYYFQTDASVVDAMVLLDIPEREELTRRLVQLGIDLNAISPKNGDAWRGYGGFGNGRRWPILFAGIMLGDDSMLGEPPLVESANSRTRKVEKFGEDGHTWYGKSTTDYPQGKPLWGNDVPNQEVVFKRFQEPGELHASGDKDVRDPDGLLDGPSLGYRTICSVSWEGEALAAQLMGAKAIWNHPAFFDYEDRWMKETGSATDINGKMHRGDLNAFLQEMWKAYRPKADGVKQLPAPAKTSI